MSGMFRGMWVRGIPEATKTYADFSLFGDRERTMNMVSSNRVMNATVDARASFARRGPRSGCTIGEDHSVSQSRIISLLLLPPQAVVILRITATARDVIHAYVYILVDLLYEYM